MDLNPAARVFRSLSARLGVRQAAFLVRVHGRNDYVQVPIEGLPDDGAAARAALPTWQVGGRGPDGAMRIEGAEAMLSFRTSRSDDLGLYVRFEQAPTADQMELLGHLRLVLSELFDEQARACTFADDMESTMRILTHDLKSPANAVAGFVDILFEDYGSLLPEGVRELLQRIRSSAARFQLILDGVYRLRLATFGRLRPARVQLGEVVRDAFLRVRDRYVGLECDFRVADGLPEVFVDAEKLELALGAIFDNAFKFREKSRALRIDVGYASMGPQQHSLVVSDTSMGFEARFRDAVFEPFRKLNPANEYPGAGVGLTVARTCLARHGGEVRLETGPSEGVRVVLVFSEPPPPLLPEPPRA
jgi:signal transduction histidine kinase